MQFFAHLVIDIGHIEFCKAFADNSYDIYKTVYHFNSQTLLIIIGNQYWLLRANETDVRMDSEYHVIHDFYADPDISFIMKLTDGNNYEVYNFKNHTIYYISSLDWNPNEYRIPFNLSSEYDSAIHFRSPDSQHDMCFLSQTKSTPTDHQFVRRHCCFIHLSKETVIPDLTNDTQTVNQVIDIQFCKAFADNSYDIYKTVYDIKTQTLMIIIGNQYWLLRANETDVRMDSDYHVIDNFYADPDIGFILRSRKGPKYGVYRFKNHTFYWIESLDNHNVPKGSMDLPPEYNSAIHFRSPDSGHRMCCLSQTPTGHQFVRRYSCFTSPGHKTVIPDLTNETQSVNQVIGIMGPIGETIPRYIFFFKEDTDITYCLTQNLDFLTEFKERKYIVIRSLDDNHTVSTHSTKLPSEYNSAIHFRSPDKQHNVCLLTQTKSTPTDHQFVRRYGCFPRRFEPYDKTMIRGLTDGTQSVNQVIGIMGPIGGPNPRYVFFFKEDTNITYCWTQNKDFLTDVSVL
ncbi:unnamed protein product [Medioppia subpectinata]|uniref:Uncharacterized protein n=1 Tax=Medioppia subpectinata TaxID=1979941 RepID=A0A7R9KP33_9ACAR|nr:unnamed protein product [Medioppia subpectinata]CAG2107178.1 unnamed protein product [Medioppia subpectinata]